MKNLIPIIFAVTCLMACSHAFIEAMTSGSFSGKETAPFVTEHPTGVPDNMGVAKRLIVSNPLRYDIEAHVECTSLFQSSQDVRVGARRERYLMITAGRGHEYDQTCFLISFVAAFPRGNQW